MTTTDVPVDTPKTDEEWHALLHNRIHARNDTYCTYGCRCTPCREAHAAHKKLYSKPTKRLLAEADTSWMKTDKKNCHGMHTGVFYTSVREGSDGYDEATAAAKAICEGCCVQRPCLEYALMTRQEGVWGGTDDKERRRIKRQRRN